MQAFNRRTIAFFVLSGLGAAAAVSSSHAQGAPKSPSALIDQRQGWMKSLGGSMKTLTAFSKGEGSAADARKAAATLNAARNMHRWWPRGTAKGVHDSKANPTIWTDQKGFLQKVAQYRVAAAAMDKAARTGNPAQVGAQLPAVGASCKSCHTAFQLKD